MDLKTVKLVCSTLSRDSVVLEWGCGGSTVDKNIIATIAIINTLLLIKLSTSYNCSTFIKLTEYVKNKLFKIWGKKIIGFLKIVTGASGLNRGQFVGKKSHINLF